MGTPSRDMIAATWWTNCSGPATKTSRWRRSGTTSKALARRDEWSGARPAGGGGPCAGGRALRPRTTRPGPRRRCAKDDDGVGAAREVLEQRADRGDPDATGDEHRLVAVAVVRGERAVGALDRDLGARPKPSDSPAEVPHALDGQPEEGGPRQRREREGMCLPPHARVRNRHSKNCPPETRGARAPGRDRSPRRRRRPRDGPRRPRGGVAGCAARAARPDRRGRARRSRPTAPPRGTGSAGGRRSDGPSAIT